MKSNVKNRVFGTIIKIIIMIGIAACNVQTPTTLAVQNSATMTKTIPSPTLTPTPPSQVEVWLTLGDQTKKLSHEPALDFAAGLPGENEISVDANQVFQQMEGFGAAMTDSSAYLLMNVMDAGGRERLLANLFSRQGNGIGLSYVRIPMGASDFALGDYTYDDMPAGKTDASLKNFSIEHDSAYIIPALQKALSLNPQLRFMGSPWSAPAWMKASGNTHGGALLPEYYQAFADYHVKFIQAYKAAGLPIDAITPQNEPMYSTEGYPTMSMTIGEQQSFVRDFLGPAIRKAGLSPHILILDHNWDLTNYANQVLSDPAAADFIDGVAFHCYGGDVSNQSVVHNAHPDKGIWFTECSGGDWAPNFADNLNWNMQNLVIGNIRNWGKSVILWNLALDEKAGPQNGGCGNCWGVVTINQTTGEVKYNEEYYVLGHVSKFVTPGAFRIVSEKSGSSAPNNVAFINPDGSIVLIVQASQEANFNVNWNGMSFTYHLPSQGVVTFKWSTALKPGPTVTPRATQTPRPIVTGVVPLGSPAGASLADFEKPVEFYAAENAEVSLGKIAHGGNASLLSHSTEGNWHVIGFSPNQHPIDLSGYKKICFWVFDTTMGDQGTGENTVGVRLIDAYENRVEHWSDHSEVGNNPKTKKDQWVQMCFNLSGYNEIDLKRVDKIEFNVYWAGDWYFDDITLDNQ